MEKSNHGVHNKPTAGKPLKKKRDIEDIQCYLLCSGYSQDINQRNYMLFTLGIVTGYRCGDLVKLKVGDALDALNNKEFRIRESKTKYINKVERRIPIEKSLATKLRKYIKGRDPDEWLFPSRKGGDHISVSAFTRILSNAGDKMGIDGIKSHSMRKTFGYWAYVKSGKDLELVRELYGHQQLHTTSLYIGIDEERKAEVIRALSTMIS